MRNVKSFLLTSVLALSITNVAKAQIAIFDGGVSTQVKPYVGAGLFGKAGERTVIGPRLAAALLKGDENAGLLTAEFSFRKIRVLHACDGDVCFFPALLMFGGGFGPTIATNGKVYPTVSTTISAFINSEEFIGLSLGWQYTYTAYRPIVTDTNKESKKSVMLLYLAVSLVL